MPEREKAAQAKLDALGDEPTPIDAALDIYNELRRAVHGGDGWLGELNERLRQEFAEFVIDRQGDELIVLPVLKPRSTKPPCATTKRAEIEVEEALCAALIPIWAGKTPPAVPLKVSAQTSATIKSKVLDFRR